MCPNITHTHKMLFHNFSLSKCFAVVSFSYNSIDAHHSHFHTQTVFWGTKMMCRQNENDADRHNTEWKESISIGSRIHLLNALSSKIDRKKERKLDRCEKKLKHSHWMPIQVAMHHSCLTLLLRVLISFFLLTITSHSMCFACHFFFSLVVFSLFYFIFFKKQ